VTLVYRVNSRQRLIIVSNAIEQMQAFAQIQGMQHEAGGVLLGRHLLDGYDVVVDEVTAPQPADRRSRFSFFRSAEHELLAQAHWRNNGGKSAYLGLWHTHPEPDPTPSHVDQTDWNRAVRGDAFEGDRLFFPIIGTRYLRVWALSRRGKLRLLNQDVSND